MLSVLGTIIGIILVLVVAGFFFWAIRKLLALVSVAEPFATLIQIALAAIVLVVVIYVILALLGMVGIPVHVLSLR